VRDYLLCLTQSGLPISFGVVFGSYAAGTANSDSDIDVMVVSPQFDKKIERQWINQLWRVAARTDSRADSSSGTKTPPVLLLKSLEMRDSGLCYDSESRYKEGFAISQ
jgi:hypothetical protein